MDTTAVDPFWKRGAIGRLKFVNRRFAGIRNGKWEYCEREGGELKRFERILDRGDEEEADEDGSEDNETEDNESDEGEVEQGQSGGGEPESGETDGGEVDQRETEQRELEGQRQIQGQAKKEAEKSEKRKRTTNYGSPRSDVGGGKRRRSKPAVPVYEGKVHNDDDEDDDGEDAIHPKSEEPAVSILKSEEVVTHRKTNDSDDVVRDISPGIASMTMNESTPKETTQLDKHDDGSQQTEFATLMQSARALAAEFKRQVGTLVESPKGQNAYLSELFPALTSASTVEEILRLSREVLARVNHLRNLLSLDFIAYEQVVKNAEARKKPDNVLAHHRVTVLEYKTEEVNARKIWMDLKTQTEDLGSRRVSERYAAK
jgi:hypothetical protein